MPDNQSEVPEGYKYPPPVPPHPHLQAYSYGPQPVFVVQQQAPGYLQQRSTNHGLHIILDLATCGMWLPIHLGVWIYNESSKPRRVT